MFGRVFQSTPVIADGRIWVECRKAAQETIGFNPRPSLLTGESAQERSTRTRPQLFQSTPVIADGRIGLPPVKTPAMPKFQSTPVIADGRIATDLDAGAPFNGFQSTPVIADGRICSPSLIRAQLLLFQSTPVIADGRITATLYFSLASVGVSIHARHC